ncbi:hypothetical protein SeLEV6574_g00258 [Synchytrium endobioticum]|uniref:Uncharacterized protein n=1 Tax=Synchytrium endobioticum TaxID=286115 RepID=A0A507DIE4_9FUNG|nr:hypothetical protein SeLEV6574_g00258 [Synchytrium endobioticum]
MNASLVAEKTTVALLEDTIRSLQADAAVQQERLAEAEARAVDSKKVANNRDLELKSYVANTEEQLNERNRFVLELQKTILEKEAVAGSLRAAIDTDANDQCRKQTQLEFELTQAKDLLEKSEMRASGLQKDYDELIGEYDTKATLADDTYVTNNEMQSNNDANKNNALQTQSANNEG